MSNSFIENVNYLAKLDNAFGDSASFTKTNISFRGSSADVKFSMSYYDNTDMKIKSVDALMQNALYSDLTDILTQFKNSIELISGFTCLFTISNDNNAYLVSSINFSIASSDSEKKITKVNFNMTKNGIELYDEYGKINNPIKILPNLALYDDILKSSIININTFKDEVLNVNSNIISINTVSDSISHIITVSNNIDNIDSVATNIVPNLAEILQSNTKASIAIIKSDESIASALASATSASEASISATTASIQANIATNQATIAINQAAIASTQASNVSVHANNALISEQNAANHLAAIEAIYDNFDDRYLGAYDADPLTDNDGNSLSIGNIYFNLTTNDVKFYNGTSWEKPESSSTQAASDALSYMNSAKTSAINAQNSAIASENSASSSNIYAANSQTSANSASTYASNAQVYATNSANSASASAISASNSEADRILAQTAATSANISATNSQSSATASESSASSALSSKTQAESFASDANTSKLAAKQSEDNAKLSEETAIQKALETSQSADSVSEDRIVVEQLESSVQNLALQVTNDKQAVSLDKQTVLNAKTDVENIRDDLQSSVDSISSKINISDVQDLLNSTDPTKPLSANQGRILKSFIDNINTLLSSNDTTLDELQEIVNFIKQNKSTLDSLGISNIAGLQSALNAKADKTEVYTKTILDLKISTQQFDKPSRGPLFIKVSPSSVKIPSGFAITVGANSFKLASDYTLTLAADLVGSTKSAGTDYFVYAKSDATFYISADDTITTDRLIGGFHYGLVGETETATGNKTEAMMVEQRGIWSHSCWDLKFRPSSSVRGRNFAHGIWVDIYLADEDIAIRGYSSPWKSAGVEAKIAGGTTDYGRAIPKIPLSFGGDGTLTYGKFTWFQATEIAASLKCFLLDYNKFPSLAYGVLECVSSFTDSYETTAGAIEHYPNLTSRYLEQAAGVQWIWGRDVGGNYSTTDWAWRDNTDSRGQIYSTSYNPTAVLFGGGRANGVNAGSRAANWRCYVWESGWGFGCRFACDHLELA